MKFTSVNPALSKTITDVLDETCKRQISFSKRIPVNMPDPTRKRFDYSQRVAIIGPDSICQIPLPVLFSDLFFQRRHGPYYAKPTRIRSGWPGQGLATLIWSESKLVCRNYRARFLARRNRPATSFPFSDSFAFFHRRPG